MIIVQKGLHLKQKIKHFYKINKTLITKTGKLKLATPILMRRMALGFSNKEHKNYSPAKLSAIVTITNALVKLLQVYVEKYKSNYFSLASENLISYFATQDVKSLSTLYYEIFNGGKLTQSNLIAELLILYITNLNPAFNCWLNLFSDDVLCNKTVYLHFQKKLAEFDKTMPEFLEGTLIQTLIAPAIAHPNSLQKQLEYLLYHFGSILGDELKHILFVSDALKEEEKINIGGAGPVAMYDFTSEEIYTDEPEAFSADSHWMPNVVLLAKSTYIWLNQLSKKYKRPILRLNEIPNEELKLIADRGFNCLWLIGIWERSSISKKIKHRCGSQDSIASAYSLKRYEIATDLGSEEAVIALKEKANNYGIKLACDMVPNHMGLDSDWLKYHPEWFIQRPDVPFPAYSFNSDNLSDDVSYEIKIEDHYYNQTDAAVVFKYKNLYTGDIRYIYHGNDGTAFPWNDTAQLNYLLPEVRKNVIKEIINIANKFKVIRFDAAMTLAKKHYQRLWFPAPGRGGDIPSRSEFSMQNSDFNKYFGKEFWREVVDELAIHAPDTLLLAEAFWMMEGYFVRSLGMHRVYNSAFMNMLKNEDNGKYKQSILNILEFNPEILKRFVNFMNNPDEEPAIIMFGSGDKYFGVCTLMATMPGLPMFGHGQVEGFHERYGMEYHSAKWNEPENTKFVNRHYKQIFPLLKKRYLFSEVKNFNLLNFVCDKGYNNNNVFCYTNICNNNRSMVVYNNCYNTIHGKVANCNKFINGSWQLNSVTSALNINPNPNTYIVFTDFIAGLTYVKNSIDFCNNGLNLTLKGYECHVYLNFKVVNKIDDNINWEQLCNYLNGNGVSNINKAIKKLKMQPFINSLFNLINPKKFTSLIELRENYSKQRFDDIKNGLKQDIENCLANLCSIVNGTNYNEISNFIVNDIFNWISSFKAEGINPKKGEFKKAKQFYEKLNNIFIYYSRIVLNWIVLRRFGQVKGYNNYIQNTMQFYDDLLIKDTIFESFKNYAPGYELNSNLLLLKIVFKTYNFGENLQNKGYHDSIKQLFEMPEVINFLQFNTYNNIVWFKKEKYNDLITIIYLTNFIDIFSRYTLSNIQIRNNIIKLYKDINVIIQLGEKSNYKVEELLRILQNC